MLRALMDDRGEEGIEMIKSLQLTQPSIPVVEFITCQLIRPPIYPFQSHSTSAVRVVEVESRTSVPDIDMHVEKVAVRRGLHVHTPRESGAKIELLVSAVQETVCEFRARDCGYKDSIVETGAGVVRL